MDRVKEDGVILVLQELKGQRLDNIARGLVKRMVLAS